MRPIPVWSVPGPGTHPYFRAIYSAFDRDRFDVRTADSILAIPADTRGAVVHANWMWNRSFRTIAETRAFVGATLTHLDTLLAGGCRLLWSVHEPFNHDRLDLEAERVLHQGIADRATVVHVLSDETVERCAGHFSLPSERVVRLPHPAFLPADESAARLGSRPDRRRAMRDALGLDDDIDLVVSVGLRRRYKEQEMIARSVRRRRASCDHRRCLYVTAGRSLTFPTDRTAARTRILGAATVESHLPADVFDDLVVAGDAVGLAYSSGLNSGVLAAAVAGATPAFVSEQLATPEFRFLGDDTFFDIDAGHDAIDDALDVALRPGRDEAWSDHAATFLAEADPHESSRALAEIVACVADGAAPDADDPAALLEVLESSPAREQLTACRLIPNERAYAVAMRRVADGAHAGGERRVEFDALVAWFESTAYEADSDDGIVRLLHLGVETGEIREAIGALHRAVDLDERVAGYVEASSAEMPEHELVEIGVSDIVGRIGEASAPDDDTRRLADDVERRIHALIEEDIR